MKKLLLPLLVIASLAHASGDMPFPFEGVEGQKPLQEFAFINEELGLLIETKQYPTFVKAWVRSTNRVVFARCSMEAKPQSNQGFGCGIDIQGQSAVLGYDFNNPEARLLLDGVHYKFQIISQ